METQEKKSTFIELRAAGRSYRFIAAQLHISKNTCASWEKQLQAEVAERRAEELETLYEEYHMKKAARIKRLGSTLAKIDEALEEVDLSTVPPEKLLDMKLKYSEALQKEYTPTGREAGPRLGPDEIAAELGGLLERVKAGDITAAAATTESAMLNNLLRVYETIDTKAKLCELEKVIGGGAWQEGREEV